MTRYSNNRKGLKGGLEHIAVLFLIALLPILLTSCPGGEVSSLILGNKINSAIDKINWGLERSIIDGDYRMEKNLRTLQLIASNIQNEFNKEMQKNRNFISDELSKNIDKIHLLVDEVKGGVLEVEDFLYLDAQNIINQLPFKRDVFSIRRIDGYGATFKETGVYSYNIIGNAFQPGKYYRISLDSITIDESNVYLRAANQLMFTLPSSKLNKRFLDFAITRVKLTIDGFDDNSQRKPFFTFAGEVLLLPKYPVNYVFTEFINTPVWSAEKYYKTFSFDLGPSGEEKRWISVGRSVSVDDQSTQRFTRVVSEGISGSHAVFGDRSFTPDYRTYNLIIANQCHDCSRTFYGTLEFEKLAEASANEIRFFESDSGSKGLLSYGTHFLTLNDKYQLFELTIKFFNGETAVLNTGHMIDIDNGLKAIVVRSENGNLKRMSLEINKK